MISFEHVDEGVVMDVGTNCQFCGGVARLVDGIYSRSETAGMTLRAFDADQLEVLRAELAAVKTPEEAAARLEEVAPDSGLADLVRGADWKWWVMFLLML